MESPPAMRHVYITQFTMTASPTPARSKIAGFLAPALLVAIAVFHLFSTHLTSQSPWKGGGFGMFSTIESPSSRVVKAWLHTADGKIPIEIPKEFGKQQGRIRTLPSQTAIDRLAQKLATATWGPMRMVSIEEQYTALTQSSASQASANTDDLNDMFARMKMVRMLDPDEPQDLAIEVHSVEVTCFQIQFDAANSQLSLAPLVTAQVAHSPHIAHHE